MTVRYVRTRSVGLATLLGATLSCSTPAEPRDHLLLEGTVRVEAPIPGVRQLVAAVVIVNTWGSEVVVARSPCSPGLELRVYRPSGGLPVWTSRRSTSAAACTLEGRDLTIPPLGRGRFEMRVTVDQLEGDGVRAGVHRYVVVPDLSLPELAPRELSAGLLDLASTGSVP